MLPQSNRTNRYCDELQALNTAFIIVITSQQERDGIESILNINAYAGMHDIGMPQLYYRDSLFAYRYVCRGARAEAKKPKKRVEEVAYSHHPLYQPLDRRPVNRPYSQAPRPSHRSPHTPSRVPMPLMAPGAQPARPCRSAYDLGWHARMVRHHCAPQHHQ